MKETDIRTSISNWNQLVLAKDSKSADAIVSKFEDCGNCFTYKLNEYSQNSQLLHLYPGIYNDKLYFFIIPKEYDKAEYDGSFSKYTVACEVYYNLQSNNIPEGTAKARINRWKDCYKTWIPEQTMCEVGMFQVFTLEPGDFQLEKSIVNMGLLSSKDEKLDRADLIVTNLDDNLVLYDDAAGVVPPYGPSAAAASFYLLNS